MLSFVSLYLPSCLVTVLFTILFLSSFFLRFEFFPLLVLSLVVFLFGLPVLSELLVDGLFYAWLLTLLCLVVFQMCFALFCFVVSVFLVILVGVLVSFRCLPVGFDYLFQCFLWFSCGSDDPWLF